MIPAELRGDSKLLQSFEQLKMDERRLTAPGARDARVAKAIDHLVHAIVHRAVAAAYRILRLILYGREKAFQEEVFGDAIALLDV